jgi:CheY-like chemotaxis protein
MSKKILLADDSITIQKVIELTFSDEDFEVVTVGNGRLALEKLPEVQPDVVLCDIIMPERDGYEVCQQIKQSASFSHVPVLLLTGAFEPFDQERAAQVGSDGFLAKPFEPETLIAKVKDLLSRAPAPTAEVSAATATPAAAPGPPPVPPRPPAPEPPPPASFEPAAPAPEPPPPASFEPAAPAPEPPPPASFEPAAPVPEPPPSPAFEPEPPGGPEPPEAGPSTEAFEEAPVASDEPGLGPSFIPEEPYETFEEATFESAAPGSGEPEPLAPVTPEESATLSGTPPAGEGSAADSASTVMFNAAELPWQGGEPGPPPASGDTAPQPRVDVQGEPTLTPEPLTSPALVDEEVLEADLDLQGSDTGRPGAPSPSGEPPAPEGPPTLKTAVPSPLRGEGGRGLGDSPGGPPGVAQPEPETSPPFHLEVPPAARAEPETIPPVQEEAPGANAGVEAEQTLPGARRAEVVESFADMETADETGEAAPLPASEAASVAVPVDMVEKIAQRVVAQVSEKVVREIVWEIVPDLAEALIKQEIDRLKAELDEL